MKKKLFGILSITCCVASAAFLTSCQDAERDLFACGSSFYWEDESRANKYSIEGEYINTNFRGSYYENDDYVFNEQAGTPHQIKNSKGKKVGTIYVEKKDYDEDQVLTVEVDGTDIQEKIDASIRKLVITSEHPVDNTCQILIEAREEPLDIYLNNVNLYAYSLCPVFESYSENPINIYATNSSIYGGDSIYKTNDIQTLLKDAAKTLAKEAGFQALNYTEKRLCAIAEHRNYEIENAKKYVEFLKTHYELDKDFKQGVCDMFLDVTGLSIKIIDDVLYSDWLKGGDGIGGSYAFITMGDVHISGEGSLLIRGGNGSNGDDSLSATSMKASHKGGNSGGAIICKNYTNSVTGDCILESGTPGRGGKIYSLDMFLGNNRGADGEKGQTVLYNSKYYVNY